MENGNTHIEIGTDFENRMYGDWLKSRFNPGAVDTSIFSVVTKQEINTNEVIEAQQGFTTGLSEKNERLLTDGLTGVKNYEAFKLDYGDDSPLPLGKTLLATDVSGLTAVNNGPLGHDGGDALLIAAAAAMKGVKGATVYRKGGDEFILVCDADISEEEWAKVNTDLQSGFLSALEGIESVAGKGIDLRQASESAFIRAGKFTVDTEDVMIGQAVSKADKAEVTIRSLLKTITKIEDPDLLSRVMDVAGVEIEKPMQEYLDDPNPLGVPLLATNEEIASWMQRHNLAVDLSDAGVKLYSCHGELAIMISSLALTER